MLCELRRISSVSAATADSIERFLSDDTRKKTPSSRKSSKRSVILTPLDDEQHSVEDDEVDSLTEKDTGIRNLIVAELTCERSESDLTAGGEERRWMKTSLIVASHNLDIMVVAAVQKFVILHRSYTNRKQFELIAQVTLQLADGAESAYITSVLPLCIASSRQSNSTNIDWTCVCLGLSDGTIHFYTERGVWVFVEKCEHEPIVALRFGPSIYPSHQELVALTGRNRLIVFEGQALYTGLNNARNKIALGEKTVFELSNTYALACHCVELDQSRGGAHDFVDVGIIRVTSFDQYVNASCSAAGRDASPTRSTLPVYTSYFCAHKDCFGTFEWHSGEMLVTELITEMFTGLTSQMTSVLPSFGIRSMLGIGRSRCNRPAKNCAIDARRYRSAERSSLYDRGRTADRCYMAPIGWGLLAVADSCARILLIDIDKRCVVRIWKGYRNARCAWIESAATGETRDRRGVRTAFVKSRTLFLAIYAPKRALLEVWSMQDGPRVAAFKVHEKGRLLAADAAERATLLGSMPPTIFGYSHNYTTAAFMFPDGSIFDIHVPFHLSAMDVSVSSIHNENFLKSFKICALLRSDRSDPKTTDSDDEMRALNVERCVTQCVRLNSIPARLRFIELIADHVEQKLGGKCCGGDSKAEAGNRQPPCVSLSDFSVFVDKLHDALMDEKKNYDNPFIGHIVSYRLFIRIAAVIRSMNADSSNVAPTAIDYSQMESTLRISVKDLELQTLRPALTDGSSHCRAMTLKSFMEQFQFSTDPNMIVTKSEKMPDKLTLISFDKLNTVSVGATLFGPFICGSAEPSCFTTEILPLLEIPTDVLFEIYVNFWLNASWNVDPQRWFGKAIEMMSVLIQSCESKETYKKVVEVIDKKVFRSINMHAALLLCLQLRVARIRRLDRQRAAVESPQRNPRLSFNDNRTDDESFSIIDDDDLLYCNEGGPSKAVADQLFQLTRTELFDLYIEQLKILALFECLPWTNLDTCDNATVSSNIAKKKKAITLEKLAIQRKGFYGELFGLWTVAHRPDPVELSNLWPNSDENMVTDDQTHANQLSERTRMLIKNILGYLPVTLQFAMTMCDCCWECVCAWTRDESRRATYFLLAVQYLRTLEKHDRFCHGLIAQLWYTHLMKTFRNLYKILNERGGGGQSRDRVLKRDVLVTENDLPDYVDCIRDMLRMLAEAAANLCCPKPTALPSSGCDCDPSVNAFFAHSQIRSVLIKRPKSRRICDSIEKTNFSRLDKVVTLFDIIWRVKKVNYHLVCHHKHLASITQLTVMYDIKIFPETLFDTHGQAALFVQLDSHPLFEIANVDESTRARRQNFLETVVEHSEVNGICEGQDRYATTWLLINGMAEDWKLDAQAIRIKQIAVLYYNGFDREAQKLAVKVKDWQLLLSSLSPVISGRIKHFMEEERDLYLKFFSWSDIEGNWLKRLDKSKIDTFAPRFPDVTPAGLKRLTACALTFTLKPAGVAHLTENKANKRSFPTKELIKLIKEYDKAANVIVRFFEEKQSKM